MQLWLETDEHGWGRFWIAVIAKLCKEKRWAWTWFKNKPRFHSSRRFVSTLYAVKTGTAFLLMTSNHLHCCFSPPVLQPQVCLLHHVELLVHGSIIGVNSTQPEPTSVNLFAACLYFLACRNARPAAAFSFPATTGSCKAPTNRFGIFKRRPDSLSLLTGDF